MQVLSQQKNNQQNRLKLLHEKWGQVDQIHEMQKQNIKKDLEIRIEDLIQQQQHDSEEAEQRFKQITEEQVLQQDSVDIERQQRETNDQKHEEQVKEVDRGLVECLQGEQEHQVDNQAKILTLIQDKFNQLEQQAQASTQEHQESIHTRLAHFAHEVDGIKAQMEQLKVNRQERMSRLQQTFESEVGNLKDMMMMENKIREETQMKIFKMIDDNSIRLQNEVYNEKQERQQMGDYMLGLLEDVVNKVEIHFKY